ncbi:MAG: dienelactone hydrolase family protein [Gammaproteobacteria bacterium]|nr:dienelactone hydrolase family protein [Gammaproteobacteria bacterium]
MTNHLPTTTRRALGVACIALLLTACAGLSASDDEELANMDLVNMDLVNMYKEHAGDSPVPSPVAWTEPVQPVTGKAVSYTSVDGKPVTGWLARPVGAADDLPALIVIHQWWGLDDSIRRAAERLAGQGYTALAVDLYNGVVAEKPPQAMKISRTVSKNKAAGLANISDAIAYLKANGATKIGVIGWCMGGRWSLFTALEFPQDIDASIIYYGGVTDDQEELAVLDMPVLGIFAGNDFIVPPKKAYRFAAAMEDLKKDLEFYMYRDADHAFSNPSGQDYNPEAAADAWEKTTDFLKRNL